MDGTDLSEADVEGAGLNGRAPKQLTCAQLRFWLSCRGVKSTKLRTKAELIERVQTILESGDHTKIIDPTKEQIYIKRKAALKGHQSSDDQTASTSAQDPSSVVTVCPASGWGRMIAGPLEFTDLQIQAYSTNCGKRAAKLSAVSAAQQKTCVRPESRGHQFFVEKYLEDIWFQENNGMYFFKCKCYPSQKKNDPLHNLWCSLDKGSGHVTTAHCSCIAGASGYCNHVMALLYQIREFALARTKHIPENLSKTSKPQAWHKPRIEGIRAEPVMECVVGSREKDNLYEVRRPEAIANNDKLLSQVQEDLKQQNPLYGFSYMASEDDIEQTTYVPTTLQTYVPKGSVLSYQLALTEGNFSVVCDNGGLARFSCAEGCIIRDPEYPTFPLYGPNIQASTRAIPQEAKTFFEQLKVDADSASAIEQSTRMQSTSPQWWAERRNRLTASHFAEICKRKKANAEKLVERLQSKPVMERKNMPNALKHGKDFEKIALRKYMRYMRNIGHKVSVEHSGLVVHQHVPYLACSPDGKVVDPVSHPHFGILEIKCPYTYRAITPLDAAKLDPTFCVQNTGTLLPVLRLPRTHDYYFQVQGQMAITGAKWCDFVVYSFKGLCIQRIPFDEVFWNAMHGKLETFYFDKYLPQVLTDTKDTEVD